MSIICDDLSHATGHKLRRFVDLGCDRQGPIRHITHRDLVTLVRKHVVDRLGDVSQPEVGGAEESACTDNINN